MLGSIHKYGIRGTGAGKSIDIGIRAGDSPHGSDRKSTAYANPVEWGHGGPHPAPPHPFVRPAFDTRKDEAYAQMKQVISDALKK